MISEKEFRNYEEISHPEEPETINEENLVEKIYEIIGNKKYYDFLPNYDLQDDKLTQDIIEVYKILFWGISALVSTLLWLYFFIT